MRFDHDQPPDSGTPVTFLNTIIAAVTAVHAMTGSTLASTCTAAATLALLLLTTRHTQR